MKRKDMSAPLGEREIIKIIQSQLEVCPEMTVPFGDDVTAYDIGDGRVAVLKTDMLVGETDVPLGMSLRQAARKAVVMNVSDFAAKGLQPQAILASLGLPKGMTENQITEIGRGLNAGAREHGSYILGGDTGEALDLIIALSLFGLANRNALMLRSGAKPGDTVAVTGLFGKPSAGLNMLAGALEAPRRIRSVLLDSVLMPHARLKEGLALAEADVVTASIDSSDGLAWSLNEISRASRVGMLLDRLPTASEAEQFAENHSLNTEELVLYGGEEYELVLTIRPSCWEEAVATVSKVGGELLRIGRVTSKKQIILKYRGEERIVEPRGYEHFVDNGG